MNKKNAKESPNNKNYLLSFCVMLCTLSSMHVCACFCLGWALHTAIWWCAIFFHSCCCCFFLIALFLCRIAQSHQHLTIPAFVETNTFKHIRCYRLFLAHKQHFIGIFSFRIRSAMIEFGVFSVNCCFFST